MLIQAAQTAARHPGPLGHFFRKLRKRKNHNIAVVATARKLATIAWKMLVTNEPYRYAISDTTAMKLARLRIAAGGKKRIGGNPKGGPKSTARLPGGSRRIKPLAEVYQAEGLPAPGVAGAGRALRGADKRRGRLRGELDPRADRAPREEENAGASSGDA